jgi:hypothetical protein
VYAETANSEKNSTDLLKQHQMQRAERGKKAAAAAAAAAIWDGANFTSF